MHCLHKFSSFVQITSGPCILLSIKKLDSGVAVIEKWIIFVFILIHLLYMYLFKGDFVAVLFDQWNKNVVYI